MSNEYVNNLGHKATIVSESGTFYAVLEPDSKVIGPYTGKSNLINELIDMGFYVQKTSSKKPA